MGEIMHGKRLIFLLCICTLAVSVSLAFNIDLRNSTTIIYNGSADDFFGFKVLQVGPQDKGIIVTAPLFNNGSGAVYRRGQKDLPPFSAETVTVGDIELPVKHLGLSIAKDHTQSRLTVCSPSVVTACNENSYMNSVCYNLSEQLQEQSSFTPAFQGCTKKTVNLVFLFDGSYSMSKEEFDKNKDFIEEIMQSLKNTSIKFAAVQFSALVRTVFTFNDYTNGRASDLLQKEEQYRDLTNTHKALRFVLENHFNNSANGGSKEATKVLVLITDGKPSDSDKNKTIDKFDDEKIIRFVIGVKDVDINDLKQIASKPQDNNTFHIENYNGLTGMLEKFQKKIFQTEGTTATLAGDLKEEMSQTGFSALYSKDALLLGSVGSQTWRGSLREVQGETEKQIEDSQMEKDSYMGYSVSVGEKNKNTLYFTGAPRYSHIGQVVLFTSSGNEWTPVRRITGEQHGSYFGGDVCAVDLDSDGSTDFLLVGAPLFYQPHEEKEGKIYIYRLTDELGLVKLFNITAHVMGRFGTTIAGLTDVNGDGLRDVAVGAPLENQNSGAVYLYLGDMSRGIRSTYSQRIMGDKVHWGLKFFGQSIDGSVDLGNDGLPDLLVGSRGAAVVLSSKPVFNVTARVTFDPHEIDIEQINCPSGESVPMVTLEICFEMLEATKSSPGMVRPGLNISHTLVIDPMRQTFRGFVDPTTKKRTFTERYELRNRTSCFKRSVHMPKCVIDTLSPISIKMNFSQVETELADAVLNIDTDKETSVEVPFEKRCRNDSCIANIEVDFDFLSETLLVGDNSYLDMSVTLSNSGEDSYNTSLTIYYPPGLSFARMSVDKDSKTRPLYTCDDNKDRTSCGVSLPVYRGKSETTFTTVFHVLKKYDWKDFLSVNITGNSDNQNSSKGSLIKDIPVQFEVKMSLLTGEKSTNTLKFTTDEPAPKQLETKYTVDNHGWKPFPVNVTLVFPTKHDHGFEMSNYEVHVDENTTQCSEKSAFNFVAAVSQYCTPERKCKYVVCDMFMLNNGSAVEFKLSGDVQFKNLSKHNVPFLKRYTGDADVVKFISFLYVSYDKQKFTLESENQKRKSQSANKSIFWEDHEPSLKSSEVYIERTVLPDKVLIIGTGAGGGLLLLIIIAIIMVKMGCFKRKLHDMVLEEEGAGANNGAANHSEETEDKEDAPEEDKALLEKQENAAPTSDDIETAPESTI